MLIVASDFHLMDGTAGFHYLDSEAYRRLLSDLAGRARRAEATEVGILFLGDVFDVIRTERWFDYTLDERPWGKNPSEEAAVDVFERIISKNKETFDMLGGNLKEQFNFPSEPKRFYIPGNHDRICNEYPSLRRRVREVLGVEGGDEPFDHHYLNVTYGVFARHGHEWDIFNFEDREGIEHQEVFEPFSHDAYMAQPVGDLMATEFATRLPMVVYDKLAGIGCDREAISDRLRHIFDVRPIYGMINWLSYQVSRFDKEIQTHINDAIGELAEECAEIEFVKEWIEKHDRMGNPFDEADRLQILLRVLKSFKLTRASRAMRLAERARIAFEEEKYALKAADDLARLDRNPEYRGRILQVLYGHTHRPEARGVDVITHEGRDVERVYINTGSWRPEFRQVLSKSGFIHWKDVTYTMIHAPGEKDAEGSVVNFPAFESWSGAIKD